MSFLAFGCSGEPGDDRSPPLPAPISEEALDVAREACTEFVYAADDPRFEEFERLGTDRPGIEFLVPARAFSPGSKVPVLIANNTANRIFAGMNVRFADEDGSSAQYSDSDVDKVTDEQQAPVRSGELSQCLTLKIPPDVAPGTYRISHPFIRPDIGRTISDTFTVSTSEPK